jgi:hypothetical protein
VASFLNEPQTGFAVPSVEQPVGNRLTPDQMTPEDQEARRLFLSNQPIPATYTSEYAQMLRERQKETLDTEKIAADREDASITDLGRLGDSFVGGARRVAASTAGQEAVEISKLAPFELAQALQNGEVSEQEYEEAVKRAQSRINPNEFRPAGPGGYMPPVTFTRQLSDISETLNVGGEAREYSLDDLLKAGRLRDDDTGVEIEARLDDIQEELDKDLIQFQVSMGQLPTMQKDLEEFLANVRDVEDLFTEDGQALLDASNIAELAAQSSALSLGIMGASALTGGAAALFTRNPAAGRVVGGATAFVATEQVEFQMEMLDQLIEAGVDPFDARDVYNFRQENQEEFNSIVNSAKIRSKTIAAGEGLTMGIAGKPAQTAANALRAAKWLRIANFMKSRAKTARALRGAGGIAGEAVVQGGVAAGAEATAAVLQNLDPNMSEVALEGLLEAVMGTTMETAAGVTTDQLAKLRDNMGERRMRAQMQEDLREGRIELENQLGGLAEVNAQLEQTRKARQAEREGRESFLEVELGETPLQSELPQEERTAKAQDLPGEFEGELEALKEGWRHVGEVQFVGEFGLFGNPLEGEVIGTQQLPASEIEGYESPVDNAITSLEDIGLRPQQRPITDEDINEALNTSEEGTTDESAQLSRILAVRAGTGNIKGDQHAYPDYKLAQLGWNKDAFQYEGNFPDPMRQIDITDKNGQDLDGAAWYLATDRSGGTLDGKVFLRRGRGRYLENVEYFDSAEEAVKWLEDKKEYWDARATKEEEFNELFEIPEYQELNDWIIERAQPNVLKNKTAENQKVALEAVNPLTGYVRFRGESRGKAYQGVLNFFRDDQPIRYLDVEDGGAKSAENKGIRRAIVREVNNVMGLGRTVNTSSTAPLLPAMPKAFRKKVISALEARALAEGLSPKEAKVEADRMFKRRQREYNFLITDTTGSTVKATRARLEEVNNEIAKLRRDVFMSNTGLRPTEEQGEGNILEFQGDRLEAVQEWLAEAQESARRPRGLNAIMTPEQSERLEALTEIREELRESLSVRAEDSPNREVGQRRIPKEWEIPVFGTDRAGADAIRNVMASADITELKNVLKGKLRRPIYDDDGNLVRQSYSTAEALGEDAAVAKFRPSFTVLQGTGDLQVREVTVYLDADTGSDTYGQWLAEINKADGKYLDAPLQLGAVEGLQFESEAIAGDVLENVRQYHPDLTDRKGLLSARARAVQELRAAREEARKDGRYEAGTWGVERGTGTVFAPADRRSGDTKEGGNIVTTPRGTSKGKQGPRQGWVAGRGDRAFEEDMAEGFANEGPRGASDRFAGQDITGTLAEERQSGRSFVESGTRDRTFTSSLSKQVEAKRDAALKKEYANRVYQLNKKMRNDPEQYRRDGITLKGKRTALQNKRENLRTKRDEALLGEYDDAKIERMRDNILEITTQIEAIDREMEARADGEGLTARAAKLRRDKAATEYKTLSRKVKETRDTRKAENQERSKQRTVEDIDMQLEKVDGDIASIVQQMQEETERAPLEELERKLTIEENTRDRLIAAREDLTGAPAPELDEQGNVVLTPEQRATQRTNQQRASRRRDMQRAALEGTLELPPRQTPEEAAAIAEEEAAEERAAQEAEAAALRERLRTIDIEPRQEEVEEMSEELGVEVVRGDLRQPGVREYANIRRNRRLTEFAEWNTYVETTQFINEILAELNQNTLEPLSREDAEVMLRAEITAQEELARKVTDEDYGYALVDAATRWMEEKGGTFSEHMKELTNASTAERRIVIDKLKERRSPAFRDAMRGFAEAMLNKDEVLAADYFNAMAAMVDAQIAPDPTVEEIETKVEEYKKAEEAKPALKKMKADVPTMVETIRNIPKSLPLRPWVKETGIKRSDPVESWIRRLAINSYAERFGISEINRQDQLVVDPEEGTVGRIEAQLEALTQPETIAAAQGLTDADIIYDDRMIQNLLRLTDRQLRALAAGEPIPESLLLPGTARDRARAGLQQGESNWIRRMFKTNRDIPQDLEEKAEEARLIAPRVQQRVAQAQQKWKVVQAELAKRGIPMNRQTAKGINMILEGSSRRAATAVIGKPLSKRAYKELESIKDQIARLSANISRLGHAPVHVISKIDSRGNSYLHASTQLRGVRGSLTNTIMNAMKGREGFKELESILGKGRLLDLEAAAMEAYALPRDKEKLEAMSQSRLISQLRDNGQAAIEEVTIDGVRGKGFHDPAINKTFFLDNTLKPTDPRKPSKEQVIDYIIRNYDQLGMGNMRSHVVEALLQASEEFEAQKGGAEATVRSEFKARDVLLSEREKTEQFLDRFLNVDINNIEETSPGNIAGREARRLYPDADKREAEQQKFMDYLLSNKDRLTGMEHRKVLQEMKARFPFVREAVDTQEKVDNYNELLRGAMLEVIDPGMRIVDTVARLASIHETSLVLEDFVNSAIDKGWVVKSEAAPDDWVELARPGSPLAAVNLHRTSTTGQPTVITDLSKYSADPTVAFAFRSLMNDTKATGGLQSAWRQVNSLTKYNLVVGNLKAHPRNAMSSLLILAANSNVFLPGVNLMGVPDRRVLDGLRRAGKIGTLQLAQAGWGSISNAATEALDADRYSRNVVRVGMRLGVLGDGARTQALMDVVRSMEKDGQVISFAELQENPGLLSEWLDRKIRNNELDEAIDLSNPVWQKVVSARDSAARGAGKAGSRVLRILEEAFRLEDEAVKVAGFMNQLRFFHYMQGGNPETVDKFFGAKLDDEGNLADPSVSIDQQELALLEESLAMAGKHVRDVFPTFSMTPEIVRVMNRDLLVGAFPSFQAEMIRNTAKQAAYLWNLGVMGRLPNGKILTGKQRALASITAMTGFLNFAAARGSLQILMPMTLKAGRMLLAGGEGEDDERSAWAEIMADADDWRPKALLPDYYEHSTLQLGDVDPETGDYGVYDLSFTNPNGGTFAMVSEIFSIQKELTEKYGTLDAMDLSPGMRDALENEFTERMWGVIRPALVTAGFRDEVTLSRFYQEISNYINNRPLTDAEGNPVDSFLNTLRSAGRGDGEIEGLGGLQAALAAGAPVAALAIPGAETLRQAWDIGATALDGGFDELAAMAAGARLIKRNIHVDGKRDMMFRTAALTSYGANVKSAIRSAAEDRGVDAAVEEAIKAEMARKEEFHKISKFMNAAMRVFDMSAGEVQALVGSARKGDYDLTTPQETIGGFSLDQLLYGEYVPTSREELQDYISRDQLAGLSPEQRMKAEAAITRFTEARF